MKVCEIGSRNGFALEPSDLGGPSPSRLSKLTGRLNVSLDRKNDSGCEFRTRFQPGIWAVLKQSCSKSEMTPSLMNAPHSRLKSRERDVRLS
jgi:hypothetical protein